MTRVTKGKRENFFVELEKKKKKKKKTERVKKIKKGSISHYTTIVAFPVFFSRH